MQQILLQLKKLQDEFGILYGVEDYRKLLSEVKLDGVIVSSPHTFHYEHAKAALEAGCHVMVEKPFTTNSKDAKELVELANKNNLKSKCVTWLELYAYCREGA